MLLNRRRFRLALPMALAMLASFALTASANESPLAWRDARQLVLVLTADWDATTGTLQRYEWRDGRWQAVDAAADITVGRTGSAWGAGLHPADLPGPQKREGDGKAPAGVFALGDAFGYAAHAGTRMPYRPMHVTSYCIDVPASPLYNRIIDTRETGEAAAAGSTEPMRLDLHNDGDPRYRAGLVIQHNANAVPGAGSCIFAHLWRQPGEATAGCTAMAAPTMESLLAWLRPQARPVFVLMPRDEYARYAQAWRLPLPEAAR